MADFDQKAYAEWRAKEPAKPTFDKPIEVDVVARRCVYVNSYRIAGGKPYVSENLPSHTLKATLGDVLNAFREEDILAALEEKRAYTEYWRLFRERKAEQSA